MSDEPDNIVLEILHRLQNGQVDLDRRMERGFQQTNERLASIEHHVAGLVHGQMRFNDDVDDLKSRVKRIERRLDLVDDPSGEPGG